MSLDKANIDGDCAEFLESWLATGTGGDPVPRDEAHLAGCPGCQALTMAFRADQERIRMRLAALVEPSPSPLQFREPLHAASGHPRRVSLAIIPFLLALLLVGLLLLQALTWGIVRKLDKDRAQYRARTELLLIEVALAQARDRGIQVTGPDWSANLLGLQRVREFLPEPGSGTLVDPYGTPYCHRRDIGGIQVYSAGPNRRDEGGRGDDIRSVRTRSAG